MSIGSLFLERFISRSRERQFAPYHSPLFDWRRLTSAAAHFLKTVWSERTHVRCYDHAWTRIRVLIALLPSAIDLNSSGKRVNGHSPSTKSFARMTPASMNSSARRIVRGV